MISLGAIGLGGLGRRELEVYAEIPDVRIVAGADIDSDARADFESAFQAPTYKDYETLLEEHEDELDAVSIVTPHTLHYEQALACLNRDLDLFIEKPMVTSIEDAKEIVETARSCDCIVQIGYQRHFHPVYQHIKQLIEDNEIGTVHTVSCFLGQDWIRRFKNSWRSDPVLSGGGQLYDSGSHLLDTVLWTTGGTPQRVASLIDERDHGVDVNSSLSVTLEREGQPITASISITADGTSTSGTEEGLFIWGTDGRIAYGKSGLTVYGKGEGDNGTSEEIDVDTDPGFETLLNRKLTAFVEAVNERKKSPVPPEFGLEVTALTEAAYRAHETSSVVDIDSLINR